MMNCVFAAIKHSIVIDGCFLPVGSKNAPKSSSFLEQACDRTGGIYLSPSGAAQVGAALTEVFMCVFLAPRSARPLLNLPIVQKVDFRAQCFETGESVDIAYVCNQCLSIFKKLPLDQCPTCQAEIKKKEAKVGTAT
jgi:transcription initiation factor TFIIH subunit 3